jgi:plastocyanin
MRFYGLALIASAVVLGACSGGEKNTSTDTTSMAAAAPAASATDTTAAAAGAAGAVAPAPATGQTIEVKMYGDATKGYKFDPSDITVKQGDAINFTVVDGAPHNIAFDPATVPAAGKAQLEANMPNPMAELSSPMLLNTGDHYTISFANVAPGTYPFHCTPHLAMGMKGTITVQ